MNFIASLIGLLVPTTGIASVASEPSSYNIAIGRNAGLTLTTGRSNILVGDGIDVPTPTTDCYTNVDGVEYPPSVRSEPWFVAMVRRRAHEELDKLDDASLRLGMPEWTHDRKAAHEFLEKMEIPKCGETA